MKIRVAIGIFLISLSLIVAILSVSVTKLICDEIDSKADQTITYILEGKDELALECAMDMIDNWDNQHKILSSYIEHEHLERCAVAISSITKYLSLKDFAAALIICQDIKTSVEHIYNSEKLTVWNVF